ncbi:hypothetical protein B0B36_02765 [Pseudomonas syringae pv. actinidifoliorum]|nr:hypothetical protein B0B36_02765 [Pseudomonas syringae pv. actinidifoliorum]
MPFWTLCVLFVALRVTQGFCDVSDVCLRLKAPFRPSASDFEGSKQAKSRLRFRPDFVGFLRPVTYVALCVVRCHRGRKAVFQLSCDAPRRMPFWTLCVLFVALRVTQGFCDVSDVCLRLKAPFRSSASDFEGSK